MTAMDWAAALQPLALACVPPLAALAGACLWRLARKAGYQGDAAAQQALETGAEASINFGISTALPIIRAKGWDSPEAWAAILASARPYLIQRFPDIASRIEAADPTARDPIHDTLQGRIPGAVAKAAASPATPPAPPEGPATDATLTRDAK